MKFIRLIIFSFVSLFAVVLIISLFIPSHIRISRATEIHTSPDSVRPYLADPLKWKSWYPNLDSAEVYREKGIVKGMSSGKQGGALLIIDSISATLVRTRYEVGSRRDVLSGWALHFDPAHPELVTVQWYMDFHLRWYPWEKFASLVFEKSYGPMMEAGLDRLKRLTEDRASQNTAPAEL